MASAGNGALPPAADGAPGPRLLYVLDRFPSYTLNFVYNEIEELEAAGYAIELYSLLPSATCPDEAKHYLARTTNLRPLPLVDVLRAWLHYLVRRPLALLAVVFGLLADNDSPRKMFKVMGHVVVAVYFAWRVRDRRVHLHAHFAFKACLAAHVAARLNRSTYSFTAHGSHTVVPAKQLSLRRKTRGAAFVLAISEYNRRTLLGLSPGYDPARIVVSRCGVRLDQFPFVPRGQRSPGPARLICIASFYAVKNHETLLAACARLQARGVDFTLDLLGGDADGRRQHMRELAGSLDIGERVHFHGVVDHGEIQRHLREADVAVLCSHNEGIPVSLMEAMAVGTPVLGPRVTGVPELVEEGVSGWLADPRRPEEFAAAIEAILADPEETSRRVAEARKAVEARYDMTANSRGRATLLRDLLARHAARRTTSA